MPKRKSVAPATTNATPISSSPDVSPSAKAPAVSFESLGLAPWLSEVCLALHLRTPTPIQTLAIPEILKGKDVCANALAGSGKTAAFALPILQALSRDPYGVFALVVTPTRELALQISQQMRVFGSALGLREVLLVGGSVYASQMTALEARPHVVTATPGRLHFSIQKSEIHDVFRRLRFLVLDEADRLLEEPSSLADIVATVAYLPSHRQTLLFSATLTKKLRKVDCPGKTLRQLLPKGSSAGFCLCDANPAGEGQAFSSATATLLRQTYLWIPAHVKLCYLLYVLRQECGDALFHHDSQQMAEADNPEDTDKDKDKDKDKAKSVIVFTNSKRYAELLRLMLQAEGVSAESLSSLQSQPARFRSLARFRAGQARVLVATDVASRGLDLPAVDAVVNVDLPHADVDYLHRVGRTARAGRSGRAISFVSDGGGDVQRVLAIEKCLGHQLERYEVDEEDALQYLEPAKQSWLQAVKAFDREFFELHELQDRARRATAEGQDRQEIPPRKKRRAAKK